MHISHFGMSCVRDFVVVICDDKIKMVKKPGMKRKENPVGYTEEGKILK